MTRRFLSVTGFVLAGGASRRMGKNKATLVLGGKTMLQRQLCLLREVCRSVAIIAPPEKFHGLSVPVLPDNPKGAGPLGAIYTGLSQTRTEFNLFIGCDLPFMDVRFLRFIVQRATGNGADVTVARSMEGRLQTLCGVYRRRAQSRIRSCLELGQKKVSCFFPQVHCLIIPWRDLARRGFCSRIFDNMNTPEEYEAARRRVEEL